MKLDRRQALLGILAAAFGAAVGLDEAEAGPRRPAKKARKRRRRRRRVRRRIRRRVRWRTIGKRRRLVVPVALAVGWELFYDDRVVVVHEVKTVEKEAEKVEVVVIVNSDGSKEEVEIQREDTEENGSELEGTELAAEDTTTPAIETEIEEEVDE